MEELSLDNILSADQVNDLFSGEIQEEKPQETEPSDNKTKEEDTIETTETNPDNLFGNKSESVGSKEDTKEMKDATSTTSDSSSNFYSSIANALVEDGVLQNLDKEELENIKTAEDFAEALNGYINNQLDAKQKRIAEALDLGIEASDIQRYEKYITTLNNITEEQLTSENETGENLRKNVIYQDYLNKGYSQEKALKMVDRSFKAGTDIEDAREALEDNKEFFQKQYKGLVDQAKEEHKKEQKRIQKQVEELKTSILESDKAFGDLTVDKQTRQKVFDSIMKPVYTDSETGERYTAVQKYEMENRTEFLKNVGLMYVLTDGFKNLDKLVQDKVKKETKKKLRDLEHTLSKGSGIHGGNLQFANNSGDVDPESLFKGWQLSV